MNHEQRTRIRLLTHLSMTLMLTHIGFSQNTSSSRSIAVAATAATVNDLSAVDCNPSAISLVRDWEVTATADYGYVGDRQGAVLRTLSLARQFDRVHAAAIKVSPGWTLDFVVPSTFTLADSLQSLQFDKKISYREPAVLAYAARVADNLSLGLAVRVLAEEVTDTKYSVDTGFVIRTSTVDYAGSKAMVDFGATWSFTPSLKLGVVGKNLFDVLHNRLDPSVGQYELVTPAAVRFGVGYEGIRNLLLSADGDTKRHFAAGGEWTVHPPLQLRGGFYVDAASETNALAVGLGTLFAPVHLDVSYLAFFSQDNRRGQSSVGAFLESGVSDIDFNLFTSNRLTVTARVNFGETRLAAGRVEYVNILKEVYPAARNLYALQPIGVARVRNMTTRPIEARVSFYLNDLMDAPSETPVQTIAAGDVAEVPLYAVFNDALRTVGSSSIREAEVRVAVSPDNEESDRYQTRVLVHARNDWNGDVSMLKYFVSPEEPAVLQFTREVLSRQKTYLDTVPAPMQNMQRARIVFDAFARRLVYVNDPRKSEDFVQFPSETLSLNGGDCDDMSVCYSSLLGSIGVSTAFVDVVPPSHPDRSHIYILFDTGIDAQSAALISDNPKRYVIRRNRSGAATAWIPIETTAITKGFDEAWTSGAQEYFDDVEVHDGVTKGWVRLVDYDAVQ